MQITIDLSPIIERLDRIEAKLDALPGKESAKQVLDAKEAAEYLGVSVHHIYRLTSTHRVPYHKPAGGRIYFKLADLVEYLTSGRVCSRDEIDALAQKWLDKNPIDRRTGRKRR